MDAPPQRWYIQRPLSTNARCYIRGGALYVVERYILSEGGGRPILLLKSRPLGSEAANRTASEPAVHAPCTLSHTASKLAARLSAQDSRGWDAVAGRPAEVALSLRDRRGSFHTARAAAAPLSRQRLDARVLYPTTAATKPRGTAGPAPWWSSPVGYNHCALIDRLRGQPNRLRRGERPDQRSPF
jgi:hypothetical protein